jgi:multicomponent Na+:H+ antiporter subunit E
MANSSGRILVPVGETETLRNTVAHAVRECVDAAESAAAPTIHFVYPVRWRPIEGAEAVPEDAAALLERVEVWAREDLEGADQAAEVEIVTEVVGRDRYLFAPDDFASVLLTYGEQQDLDRIVLDPEYAPSIGAPMLEPLRTALERGSLAVESAPVTRRARRSPLQVRSTLPQLAVLFGAIFGFYLLTAGTISQFELLTGAVTAALVAFIFSRISLSGRQSVPQLFVNLGRIALYVPYLLWEILKANFSVAYIILHPSLPIDPGLQQYQAAVFGDLSVTTLANSITLTPGTLTVDIRRDSLYIHSLNQAARDGLLAGGLERAVRFVFYGLAGRELPTPAERGAIQDVQPAVERLGLQEAVEHLADHDQIAVPETAERGDE